MVIVCGAFCFRVIGLSFCEFACMVLNLCYVEV